MFCPVSGYKNYIINNNGTILNKDGKVMKHNIHKDGYHQVGLTNGIQKRFLVHRLVYQHFGNDWDKNLTVDHHDNDKSNNHISNLRMATQQQQQFNRPVRKNNKLGVKGIRKVGNKYQTQIRIDGKEIYLGLFETVEEASLAYQTKARELHGEFFNHNVC